MVRVTARIQIRSEGDEEVEGFGSGA
jgi:hypothetical protein